MNTVKVAKIICEIYKENTSKTIEALKKIGIDEVHIQPGKNVVLREKSRFSFLPSKTVLEDDPIHLFRFYVPLDKEEYVLNKMIGELSLNLPGRGTIYSELITLLSGDAIGLLNPSIKTEPMGESSLLQGRLMGICCIVQRGLGNTIVTAALDSGSTVPSVIYGEGTGLRDKLGLLRLTIPAEKEIVMTTVSENDADELMNVMIEAGKLDQPGKGFIYNYPVSKGIINSRIFRGKQKHAASMEQVILAIDEMRGNTDWRRRSEIMANQLKPKESAFLTNLYDMTIICNDGWAMELVKASMNAGASGATISKSKYHHVTGKENSQISLARESANLIVSEGQKETLLKAISDAEAFGKEASSVIEIRPSPKARTYLGKKS